ncbi:hypothetical protein PFISCL1PPCAC_9904 [Pristionchus fissidentatus]|uniref:Uncharacterized protein n=1 Tax=Pristionchus fissidentatus TaxID=1538716 RepID=A0AAV5VFV1_9BILA|nr:hypothetical protein PFISCL1PPCAC_9904 [Pristionchus fissidentatus]
MNGVNGNANTTRQKYRANAIPIKEVVIDCCIHEQWSAQKQCDISCSLYGGAGKWMLNGATVTAFLLQKGRIRIITTTVLRFIC